MIRVIEINSTDELELAFEIRKKVFVEEQNVPIEEEYDNYENSSFHILAFFFENPVGTARMRKTESGFKLERFCVLKNYRGKGVGTALIKKLLIECKKEKSKKVYLYAQLKAKFFYEKFNFKEDGEVFFDAGIEHVAMYYK